MLLSPSLCLLTIRMLNAPSPANSFFSRINGVQRSTSYSNPPPDRDDEAAAPDVDVRRGASLRVPGTHGGARNLSFSFGTAASNLSSPIPAAARSPLFSHHAIAIPNVLSSPEALENSLQSSPPSPGSVSSSGFSPASAFLSHFSSHSSLRQAAGLAEDAPGAQVLDYTLGKILGRGGFSTVRLATQVFTGEVYACKIVKRDDLSDRSGSLEKFEEEITTWRSLPRHPSFLPLLNMHRTAFATYLITPFMPGGSLLDVLRRDGGSESTARKWYPGIVTAVSALHDGFDTWPGGVLHGDLKLDNFLVDQHGHVVVTDFYMAQRVGPSIPPPLRHARHLRKSRQSSPFPSSRTDPQPRLVDFPSASLPYAPPELLSAHPSGLSLAQDIWALGIILYALLTSRLPFADAFDPRLQMKILRGTYDPPEVGREWLDCLTGCLDGNVDNRWTIRQLRESDAITGWREVRPHSSRSRSRGCVPRRGRSGSTSPVDSFTPRHRSGSRSTSRTRAPESAAFEPELRELAEDVGELGITRGRSAVRGGGAPRIDTAVSASYAEASESAVTSGTSSTSASTSSPSGGSLFVMSPLQVRGRAEQGRDATEGSFWSPPARGKRDGRSGSRRRSAVEETDGWRTVSRSRSRGRPDR